MRVLIASASRHGATAEIADYLGGALRERHVDVDVADVSSVTDIAPYDAVVVGSSVYVGHWLASAKTFIRRFGHQLQTRPVWLFSSGPVGNPPKPLDDPIDIPLVQQLSGAREHRVFTGRLSRGRLKAAERMMVRMVTAQEGDFRDWPALDAWAAEIATALAPARTATDSMQPRQDA